MVPMSRAMPFNPNPEQLAAPRQRRGDDGFTLSEVIVAISLTGVLILAVMAGAWTLVRASRVSDDQAAVEATLGAAADRLTQFGWQPCPEMANVDSATYAQVVGAAAERVNWPTSSVQIDQIHYWNIETEQFEVANPFADPATGSCTPTDVSSAAAKMQMVRIRVTSPGGTQSRTLDVVVADIRFLDEQDDL